jgi:hypothetical protein
MAQLEYVAERVQHVEHWRAEHEKVLRCYDLEDFFTEAASIGLALLRYAEDEPRIDHEFFESICRRWIAISEWLTSLYDRLGDAYELCEFNPQPVGEVFELQELFENRVAEYELSRIHLSKEELSKLAQWFPPAPAWSEEDWVKG